MLVFIEEDLIQKSIESILPLVDKLVIVVDKNLDSYSYLEKYKLNTKIKIITIKKMKRHYSFYANLAYKKCRYKYFCKFDADQIYILENMKKSIEYCMQNKDTVVYMSGVNVYNKNRNISFLKNEIVKINDINIRCFNGGVDHSIVPKALLSKFSSFEWDGRQIEVYKIFNVNFLQKHYTAMNWIHYGPIKIGLNIKDNITTNLNEFYDFCQNIINFKKSQDYWLNSGMDNTNLSNFYTYLNKNNLMLNQYIQIYQDNHIENTKHQWAIKNLKRIKN